MDVLHDNSHRTWVQLGNTHEDIIPDYVMEYTPPDEKTASEISDELFADSARRFFPVDSPAATWLSAAYFGKGAGAQELPYKPAERQFVLDTLLKAAEVHGNTEDVQTILDKTQVTPQEKQAADDDGNYGWVMRHKDTGEVLARKYPMFDARGVKLASAYFDEYRQRYPQNIRRNIARNIMDKAAAYELDTDDLSASVLREAGYGIPRKEVLMEEILERAHLTKDAESAIVLANINEMIAGLGDKEIGENLSKIAEVIDAFDQQADLVRHYGHKILMPADFLFDVNMKTAEAAVEDAVELDKFVFSLSKLAELSPSTFTAVLGDEFGRAIVKGGADDNVIDQEKLSDELHSLPRPDKTALEEHLAAL